MQIVVGPVLRREDGYAFDLFEPERGMKRGSAYRRIEDALYARRVESNDTPCILCRTVEEFTAWVMRAGCLPV